MLETSLARLETSELVRRVYEEELTYLFRHALVQDTARASLLLNERKRLHRLVGEALERVYPENRAELAPLLAQHFAEAGDDAKTLEYAELSGDAARRINARAEALTCYTRALNLALKTNAPSAQLQQLFLKRGRVMEVQGDFQTALKNYDALIEQSAARADPALELAALMAQATIHSIPSLVYEPKRAQELSDRALVLARELDDKAAEAKILWNLMLMNSRVGMGFQRAFQYGEEALHIARENNLRERLAYVLNDIAPMYYYAGKPELGKQANLEARAMWRELDNMPMLSGNYGYAAMNHLFAGEFAEAVAASQEGVRLSREIGNEWNEAFAQTWVGEAYLELGEIETAERVMLAAIELGERAFPPTLLMTRSELARMYTDFGNVTRGIELSELALEVGNQRFPPMRPIAASALAHALLAEGNLERARQILKGTPRLLQMDTNPMFAADGVRGQVELALAEKNFAEALSLCEHLRDFAERVNLHQYLPAILRGQAEALIGLGRVEEAAQVLDQARTLATEINARWSLWQILATSARAQDARGNAEHAETCRAQARELIEYISARTPQNLRAGFLAQAEQKMNASSANPRG
ncbi:MAG: hypothetical protein BroJett039_02850 [Chloroflexota bacterium]|nr:MAG: hypothetical protein BroJett039_02850 [Chloroflexota bacterium]